jgi:hypothetical protein
MLKRTLKETILCNVYLNIKMFKRHILYLKRRHNIDGHLQQHFIKPKYDNNKLQEVSKLNTTKKQNKEI